MREFTFRERVIKMPKNRVRIEISLTKVQVYVLIFSLLPFIIGMSYSLLKSEETAYLSSAINIAGSQRMRTMLLSNYSNQLLDAMDVSDTERMGTLQNLLTKELDKYQRYVDALIEGDATIPLAPNRYEAIKAELKGVRSLTDQYSKNVFEILSGAASQEAIDYVIVNAMEIKEQFDYVTNMYQQENDRLIHSKRRIDLMMITLGLIITAVGLFYTTQYKTQEKNAKQDYLTGLNNRHSLMRFMKSNHYAHFCLFFMDLDKFKQVNDNFGHEVGDQVLKSVGEALASIFSSNMIFRFGGDEFIGLVPLSQDASNSNRDIEVIESIIGTVKLKVNQPIMDAEGVAHQIGISMGVTLGSCGIRSWEELIKFTDHLMYDSKLSTTNVLRCYDYNAYSNYLTFAFNSDDLLRRRQIALKKSDYYQLSSNHKMFEGFFLHALVEETEIQPSAILRQFKKDQMLPELDKYLFKELIDLIRVDLKQKHAHQHQLKYMLNVSIVTIGNSNSNGFIDLLEEHRFLSEHIVLRVNNAILSNRDMIMNLEIIKALGYQIALDAISIDRLIISQTIIPFEYLTISKDVTNLLLTDSLNYALYNALVEVANKYDFKVAFSGLTVELLEKLKSIPHGQENIYYSREYSFNSQ